MKSVAFHSTFSQGQCSNIVSGCRTGIDEAAPVLLSDGNTNWLGAEADAATHPSLLQTNPASTIDATEMYDFDLNGCEPINESISSKRLDSPQSLFWLLIFVRRCRPNYRWRDGRGVVAVAVGETVILLHPPPPLAVFSIGMERECQ